MAEKETRISASGMKVLRLFLTSVRKTRSGAEITRESGVGAGTLYPMLARFERDGLLTSAWEDIDPREEGRPRRRLYRISGEGIRVAQTALAKVQISFGRPAWSR